jgi:hypothetical protein
VSELVPQEASEGSSDISPMRSGDPCRLCQGAGTCCGSLCIICLGSGGMPTVGEYRARQAERMALCQEEAEVDPPHHQIAAHMGLITHDGPES